jgi:hypothetical protein
MFNIAAFRVIVLFTLAMAAPLATNAEGVTPRVQVETASPPSLRAALARATAAEPMRTLLPAAAPTQAQTDTTPTCRRGRRAWIGALIGAGASVPLAMLAHSRFENENASGAGAAATMIALGAGGGALVGLATCR